MKNLINRYTYREEWSEEDSAYISRCLEFPSLAAHGSTPEEALAEIKSVVQLVLADMEAGGEEIPEPFGLRKFRGNLSLRVPADIHRHLAIQAAEQGVSINQLILSRL